MAAQTYPKAALNVLVITEGNSEEAKGLGLSRCRGDFVGMCCTDNEFVDPDTLDVLVLEAGREGVVGAYPARYRWVATDTALSRYFALLGANDPLCWWLGKADRESYMGAQDVTGTVRQVTYLHARFLPSLGDNGCVFKLAPVYAVLREPHAFGSCMCLCEDLKAAGYATYAVLPDHAVWHRTGASLWVYLKKRWRYTNDLYWDKRALRRWRMVDGIRDGGLVLAFAGASLLVVPQVCVSLYGYRQKRDPAWFLHVPLTYCLTLLYACSMTRAMLRSCRLWCVRTTARMISPDV